MPLNACLLVVHRPVKGYQNGGDREVRRFHVALQNHHAAHTDAAERGNGL